MIISHVGNFVLFSTMFENNKSLLKYICNFKPVILPANTIVLKYCDSSFVFACMLSNYIGLTYILNLRVLNANNQNASTDFSSKL